MQNNRYLRALFLSKKSAALWGVNRHSVALGVVSGLLVCFLPIPGQTVLAALLAFLFSANVPVAILTTWISNPFTFLPFNILIYSVGAWVLGIKGHCSTISYVFSSDAMRWFFCLGKVYVVGVLLVSIIAALIGYVLIQLFWWLVETWRKYWSAR